ncbi:hypothetical protein ACFL2Y_02555 [Candidatus Omnitrophota bacterium]
MTKYAMRLTTIFVAIISFSASFPKMAYAYINPGPFSYLSQLLIAALIGGLTIIKLSWKQIKSFFENLFKRKQ